MLGSVTNPVGTRGPGMTTPGAEKTASVGLSWYFKVGCVTQRKYHDGFVLSTVCLFFFDI